MDNKQRKESESIIKQMIDENKIVRPSKELKNFLR